MTGWTLDAITAGASAHSAHYWAGYRRLVDRLPKLTDLKFPLPVVALLLAHLVFAAVLGLRALGQLQSPEMLAYDFVLARQAAQQAPDPRITLIWLTDADQRAWGWPLSDAHLAQLLDTLLQAQARAIGLDLYRDMPVPPDKGSGYARLSQLLKNHAEIIGITKFADAYGVHVAPPPALVGTNRVTFNDVTYDAGYISRRGLLYLDDGQGNWHEYFGLKLVLRYLNAAQIYPQNDAEGNLVLGSVKAGKLDQVKARFPAPLSADFGAYVKNDAAGYQFLFSYPGAPLQFQSYTLTDMLEGAFDPALIRDRIVIIGTRAEATPDFFTTPISRWLSGDQRIAGAAVHAYGTSQLLQWALGERPLQPNSWDNTEEQAWIWLWCMLAGLACLWTHDFWRFFLVGLGGLGVLGSIFYLAFNAGWWLLLIAPGLGWIGTLVLVITYEAYRTRSERVALMSIFSKHVSKEVADLMWQSRDQYLREGRLVSQRLTATVLFTDLQNFTTVSEAMEAQALMNWLNQYMESMVRVVEQHQGQVNKFIGDALMAIFGVPIPRNSEDEIAHDAIHAVECALAMRDAIEQLREQWLSQGLPSIRMRVGIFTGPLIAGCLGGIQRQEYTVLGDTVNTASRLESFDKTLDTDNPCRILIGDSTLRYLGDRFETQSVGSVHLKGKSLEVAIHLVRGRKPPVVGPKLT